MPTEIIISLLYLQYKIEIVLSISMSIHHWILQKLLDRFQRNFKFCTSTTLAFLLVRTINVALVYCRWDIYHRLKMMAIWMTFTTFTNIHIEYSVAWNTERLVKNQIRKFNFEFIVVLFVDESECNLVVVGGRVLMLMVEEGCRLQAKLGWGILPK